MEKLEDEMTMQLFEFEYEDYDVIDINNLNGEKLRGVSTFE